MKAAKNPVYALGHSTRPIEEFVDLLQAHGIQLLCDIRTIPKSRRNRQFSRESLEKELPRHQIRYRHLKGLGGLRRPEKNSINAAWRNSSFRGYADYMQTEGFDISLAALIELSGKKKTAVMCAEGNPYRCHRLLVADALTAQGVPVMHICSRKTAKPHQITAFARVKGKRITYPESKTRRLPRPASRVSQ
jgi:uncharacterized protein (DUF488 family)